MKLIVKLFSKKTALLVKLRCAKEDGNTAHAYRNIAI
jgi:hypothetical protein